MKSKDYIYYGLFLDEDSKLQVIRHIEQMDGYNKLLEKRGKLYLDHCTLLHCSQEDKFPQVKKELIDAEKDLARLGKDRYSACIMKVTHIGYLANKVMAIRVNTFSWPCANETPHITVCTFGDGKPVDSNKIETWDEFPEPFVVYGSLRKVVNNNK